MTMLFYGATSILRCYSSIATQERDSQKEGYYRHILLLFPRIAVAENKAGKLNPNGKTNPFG